MSTADKLISSSRWQMLLGTYYSVIESSSVGIPVLRVASSIGDIQVHSAYYVLDPSSFWSASPPPSLYNALVDLPF